MSIQKIARLAGVSVATVSRVLNNLGTVKPQNRERVLNAIKESNYQPNLLARQLRTARSNMLLVMVSNIANPFCADVVKGIEAEAEKNGYRILLCNSGSDLARSQSSLQLLSGKMVDGVITMDALAALPGLQNLIGDAPWVQCAEYDEASRVSTVGIDDRQASRFVAEQFLAGGRRQLAMINHDLTYKYAQQREQGFRDVLAEQQQAVPEVAYASELTYQAGKAAMAQLLQHGQRPDAVFAVSDTLAAGAIATLREAGIRVPEETAVIGFDGTELGHLTSPPLSTIEQPSQEIGRQAVLLLLNNINDPDSQAQHTTLAWRYLARGSA
ncbi:LacI family DNA-binding transcriptional regulator [Erwinia sp. Leaf53]|uniref:LacI family DNA-binding transcriptional regulator n=1 Tax=Erwinia sp. Leaf53 TaxID=1736225 RepID=UPI0006F30E04|nr:LacI family DNA-binding transcriptional regulator [Erwinia sp. Leaf53]KQN53421.1 cytochrome C peroxidase [Erwinia sp. Leaf53]